MKVSTLLRLLSAVRLKLQVVPYDEKKKRKDAS